MADISYELFLIFFGAFVGIFPSYFIKNWLDSRKNRSKILKVLKINLYSNYKLLREHKSSNMTIDQDYFNLLFNSSDIHTLNENLIILLIQYRYEIELFNNIIKDDPEIKLEFIPNYKSVHDSTVGLMKLVGEGLSLKYKIKKFFNKFKQKKDTF